MSVNNFGLRKTYMFEGVAVEAPHFLIYITNDGFSYNSIMMKKVNFDSVDGIIGL
jgi:hypothetical protein